MKILFLTWSIWLDTNMGQGRVGSHANDLTIHFKIYGNELAKCIIIHELSFNYVENERV